MACATAACPTLLLDLQPLRGAARRTVVAVSCVAQMAGFAAVLWLLVAGPGFLADQASTVTVPHAIR